MDLPRDIPANDQESPSAKAQIRSLSRQQKRAPCAHKATRMIRRLSSTGSHSDASERLGSSAGLPIPPVGAEVISSNSVGRRRAKSIATIVPLLLRPCHNGKNVR